MVIKVRDIFGTEFQEGLESIIGYKCHTINGDDVIVKPLFVEISVPFGEMSIITRRIIFKNETEYEEFMKFFIKVLELIYYRYPITFDFDNYSDVNNFNIVYKYNNEEVDETFLEKLYQKHDKIRKNISYEERKKLFYDGKVVKKENTNDIMKRKKKVYDDLLKEFEILTEDEKDAILIYKSSIFECINLMSSIPYFRERDPEELFNLMDGNEKFHKSLVYFFNSIFYKKNIVDVHDNPELYDEEFVKIANSKYDMFDFDLYAKLEKIKISSYQEFIDSLINIYDLLCSAALKMSLPTDITLFRGIPVDEGEVIDSVARGSIVSTDIDFLSARRHSVGSRNKKVDKHIIKLNVDAGVPCVVSPYTILRTDIDYGNKRCIYKVVPEEDLDDTEIILFKHLMNIEYSSSEVICFGDRGSYIIDQCEVSSKTNKRGKLNL